RTGLYHRLNDPWHLVPLAKIDEKMRLSAALPPSGIVVVLGDLDETELLIVIGTDPLGGIDCALLERGKDVASGKLLRHDPELRQDAAGKAPDAELQPPHVVEALDLPAEPAAHLASRVAGRHAPTVIGLEEVVEQLHTAALELPGLLLASVESERQSRAERERRVLAKIVIAARMAHLDRAVLHRVKHLQAGYDLACGEHLDLKLVLAEFSDPLGHVFGRAIERVERLGPARRQPPAQLRHGLSNGRSGDRGCPIQTPAALRNSRRFMVDPPCPLVSFFDAGHRRKNAIFIDGRKRNV